MATPDFIVELRKGIGHDLLWLVGVTAFVQDGSGRLLLGRRADTGEWALVCGINEPGEEPADTCVREVFEETGVDVEPVALAAVKAAQHETVYANGDRTMYLDLLFVCRLRPDGAAEPRVNDDESLDVGWFDPDDLPTPLSASAAGRIARAQRYLELAAAGDAQALFWGGANEASS